jgi:hypothetical protein
MPKPLNMPKTLKDRINDAIVDEAQSHVAMTKNLVVRVPESMHAQLVMIAQQMTKEIPGRRTTISDVARGILEFALRDRPAGWPVHLLPHQPTSESKK